MPTTTTANTYRDEPPPLLTSFVYVHICVTGRTALSHVGSLPITAGGCMLCPACPHFSLSLLIGRSSPTYFAFTHMFVPSPVRPYTAYNWAFVLWCGERSVRSSLSCTLTRVRTPRTTAHTCCAYSQQPRLHFDVDTVPTVYTFAIACHRPAVPFLSVASSTQRPAFSLARQRVTYLDANRIGMNTT